MSSVGFQVDIAKANQAMDRLPPATQDGLRIGISQATTHLRAGVSATILSLFQSDGPLYKSIGSEIEESPGTVTGSVYSRGVVYNAAQEYGGTWEIPEIFPVNAKALAFGAPAKVGFSSGAVATGTIFAMHTKAHPVTLPARSYARSTLFRMRGELAQDVASGVKEKV